MIITFNDGLSIVAECMGIALGSWNLFKMQTKHSMEKST